MELLTKNAIQILEDRYLLKNDKGVVIETPDALFKRVAEYISGCEKKIPPNGAKLSIMQ